MMKSTLIYSVLVIFFLTWTQVSSAMTIVGVEISMTDTIPENERFDEPLSGAVKSGEKRKTIKNKPGERLVIPIETIETDTTYRNLLEVPKSYSGYKIELMSTSIPLPVEHDLFFQHGKITLEKLGENQCSYLIGHFESEEKAESFRSSFLEGRYPDSIVVEYLEGKRQNATVGKQE
ncbi:MAG: hypothetical protein HRU12_01440 [Phaeodactylibacter sp.]|nr:hypothetical protein [Phaeodactylibacter sp.]